MKITESMKKATLNADNRERFIAAVLNDAFKARSEKLQAGMVELIGKLGKRTWGKTPQAQAALRKKVAKVNAELKTLEDKGVSNADNSLGRNNGYDLSVNAAGRNLTVKAYRLEPTIVNVFKYSFDRVYLSGTMSRQDGDGDNLAGAVACRRLTLLAGDPLLKQLDAIQTDWDATSEAAKELRAQVAAILKSCKTFGKALEKWPGLAKYADSILSESREIAVSGEVIEARIKALREGMTASDAMSINYMGTSGKIGLPVSSKKTK